MYPTPHSFVTLISTTKLGLGLPSNEHVRAEEAGTGRDGKRTVSASFPSRFFHRVSWEFFVLDWSGINQETVFLWVLWAVLLFSSPTNQGETLQYSTTGGRQDFAVFSHFTSMLFTVTCPQNFKSLLEMVEMEDDDPTQWSRHLVHTNPARRKFAKRA